MKPLVYSLRGALGALVVVLLVVVAVGCDGMSGLETGERDDRTESSPSPIVASKYTISGNGYYVDMKAPERGTDTFYNPDGSVAYSGPYTKFIYDVVVPANGIHFALEAPECATFVAASGATTDNNEHGDIEWHSGLSSDPSSPAEIWYAFAGDDVPVGAVEAWSKSQGNTIEYLGPVDGPCRGVARIQGMVYLERSTPEAANTTYDPAEDSGIPGVEVVATDGETEYTETTRTDGSYLFEVFVPWFDESTLEPLDPPVSSATFSVGLGANEAFDGASLFIPTDSPTPDPYPVTASAYEPPAAGPVWGFRLDVDKALALFDPDVTDIPAVSDGLPRMFWRVQITGKGTVHYRPVILPPGTVDLANDFLRMIDTEGHFGSSLTADEIYSILKQSSDNDDYEGLRTSALVLGLNYAWGRGLCREPGDPLMPNPDPNYEYPVCRSGVDEMSTRLVIQMAIADLSRINPVVTSKAPTGTRAVVDEFNNE